MTPDEVSPLVAPDVRVVPEKETLASALAARLCRMLSRDVALVAAATEPRGAEHVALVTLRVGSGGASRYCAGAGAGDSIEAGLWSAMTDAIGGRTSVLSELVERWAMTPGVFRATAVGPDDPTDPLLLFGETLHELAASALASTGGVGIVAGHGQGRELRVLALGRGAALILEVEDAVAVAAVDAWLDHWADRG